MRLWRSTFILGTILVSVSLAVDIPLASHWDGGLQGEACFDITEELHSWNVILTFDHAIQSLQTWVADVVETKDDGKVFVLHNKEWNKDEHVGDRLCISFMGTVNGDINPKVTGTIQAAGDSSHPLVTAAPGQTLPTTTAKPFVLPPGNGPTGQLKVTNSWSGNFEGFIDIPITEDVFGWVMNISYDKPVSGMTNFQIADAIFHSSDGYNWAVVNRPEHTAYHAGDTVHLRFTGSYSDSTPPSGQAKLFNLGKDTWTVATAPNADKSKYNYNDVLQKSILFYEAQRSGKLPTNKRIPWRFDSALGDKGEAGEDLTGGWYDAGDHVKFNFPMAYSTTILTWSYLLYADAYESAGQTDYMLDCIKWPLDYLLKCHVKPNELYIQVGDGGQDHGYWGPPELMTMPRPAFKITTSKPGSEVAMETAAAFAAGSLAFKTKDPTYSSTLLDHAKQLWDFAMNYRGKYSDSVNAAAGYYNSNNITDELCWGSLWLYQATNDPKYLADAEKYLDDEPAWGMSWDDKTIANQVLLYKLTKKDRYKTAVEGSYKMWFPGGSISYTPKGLAYRLQWGSLRYSSNMAMAALVAADAGLHPDEYRHWAMCQIHYALGDTGFSYVIGFGDKYPLRPHHRSSSCPNLPSPCGTQVMPLKEPNVHILYGALVGGPGSNDDYTDDRSNYVNNEVACDYNAGFQAAVAALKSLWLRSEHPEQKGNAQCPFSTGSGQTGGVVGR
ncbi:endoglucanase 4 [Biomphalaria glabrata]|uniref:Endoglucanase n=1 Tax=Biomphalaria glabrata TaxID=6526 RepID=A0A9U8E200_BIOGL|nr:endoglucanase 4 [Biomphalaria glabrata]